MIPAIIGKILGSGDIIKSGIDLIDDMHTSKEEEIEAKTKAKIDLINAYAPFKVAQRYLALMFTFTFLSCFVMVLVMTLSGQANIDQARQVITEFYIGEIMLVIVGFYFSGGMIEGVVRTVKDKK
jgi:hypothetical protein